MKYDYRYAATDEPVEPEVKAEMIEARANRVSALEATVDRLKRKIRFLERQLDSVASPPGD